MPPASGLVYVDTQIVIYSIETQPPYWQALTPLWEAAQAGRLLLVTSELTLMETLVGPLKHGDGVLASAYEELFGSTEVRLLPITRAVLREAARLRAGASGLRTPDALHAATAMLHGCAMFLTNDKAFRRVPGLSLTVLDDAMAL